jgi:hypothetical protein
MPIVTDGDRILCDECYQELFCAHDPSTHCHSTIQHGVCDLCGLETVRIMIRRADYESDTYGKRIGGND